MTWEVLSRSVLSECLGFSSMVPRGPFYRPKGPRSHWSFIWKLPTFICSRVHQTLLVSWSGGTRLSSDPFDCRRCWRGHCSRWPPGTLDFPVLYLDCRVIFSWGSRVEAEAGQFAVEGTRLSGAAHTRPFSSILCQTSLASFGLTWEVL
jgi:hypothetical protein